MPANESGATEQEAGFMSAAEFREQEIMAKQTARFGRVYRADQKVYEHEDYMDFAERYADYVCSYEKGRRL